MELLLVIVGLIALIGLYFFLGVIIKFLWAWLPMVLGLLISLAVGLSGGWVAAGIGVFLALLTLIGADSWHRTDIYQKVESTIEKIFYFDE